MTTKPILLLFLYVCFYPISDMFSQENIGQADTIFLRGYLEFREQNTAQKHEKPYYRDGYGTVYFGEDKALRRYVLNYYREDSLLYVDASYDNAGQLQDIWFRIEQKSKPLILGSVSKDKSKSNSVLLNYEIRSTDSLQSGIVLRHVKQFPRRILHWNLSDYLTVKNLIASLHGEKLTPLRFPYKVKFRLPKEADVTYITANGVGVREEPNAKSRVREARSTGHRFRVEEVMQMDSVAPWGTFPWYKVRWERAMPTEYGYIFGAFVDQVEEVVPSRRIKSTSFKSGNEFTNNTKPGRMIRYHVNTIGIPDGDSIRFRLKTSDGEILKEYIMKVENNIAESPEFEVLQEWLDRVLPTETSEVFEE